MLPGAGQMKEALAQVDDSQLDRVQAIIRGGMTPPSVPIRRSTAAPPAHRQRLRVSRSLKSTSLSTAGL